MSDVQLVRVEMEFADGKIQRLTGEAAQVWLKDVNGMVDLGRAHGMHLKEHPWESTHKDNEHD